MQDDLSRLVGLGGFRGEARARGWRPARPRGRAGRARRRLPALRACLARRQGPPGGAAARSGAGGARDSSGVAQAPLRLRRVRADVHGAQPELPPRQRVTRRFRRHLFARVRGGGAHAEVARDDRTTRYQVARAFRAGAEDSSRRAARRGRGGGCRSTRPTTAAAANWPRSSPTSTVGAWWRCSTVAHGGGSSATCARCPRGTSGRSRSSRSTPTRPTARRSTTSFPGRGSWSTTSTSCAAPTPRSTRSGASAPAAGRRGAPLGQGRQLAPGPLPRPPPAAQGKRAADRARAAAADRAVRARAHDRGGLGTQGARPLDLPRARPARRRAPTRSLPRRRRAGTAARLHRLRRGRPALARRTARLLRRADHQRLRRGRHQQSQAHQAPRLRPTPPRRLPAASAPSMRLNGTTRRHPARSTRTPFRPARVGHP
jgi:hypothetical protein